MKQLKTYAAQHGFDYSNMLVDFLNSPKKEQKEFLAQIGMQEESEGESILAEIQQALQQGAKPEDVYATLLQEGISEEEAQGLVQQAMQGSMQVGGVPVTRQGYYELDPYENPEALIPSGNITMEGLDFEIDAFDAQTGKHLERMQPGQNYEFDTDMVLERPVMAQSGFVKKVDKGFVYLTDGRKLTQKQFKENYLDRVEDLNKNKYNTEERRNVVRAVQEYRTLTQPKNKTSNYFSREHLVDFFTKDKNSYKPKFNTTPAKVTGTLQPIETVYDSFDADKVPAVVEQTLPKKEVPKITTKNPRLTPKKEIVRALEGDDIGWGDAPVKKYEIIDSSDNDFGNYPVPAVPGEDDGWGDRAVERLPNVGSTDSEFGVYPEIKGAPRQKFTFDGSNIARNLMLASRVSQAYGPTALPFRQHVSLAAEELPEIDVSPVLAELTNRFKLASKNINANSTTGQALAANFYGKTLDEMVKVTNQAQQQNQQIKAKNRFGLVTATNKEQSMNQAFDAKAYDEMLANHASADTMKMQASNDVLEAIYADKSDKMYLDSMLMTHPELEEEADWKSRLLQQRIFSRNPEFNKIYTKPLVTK